MKNKFTPDFWVTLGILIVSVFTTVGGTIAFCFTTFATKSEVQVERDERKEMKAEIDQLYQDMIPESQRKPLVYHHEIGEQE